MCGRVDSSPPHCRIMPIWRVTTYLRFDPASALALVDASVCLADAHAVALGGQTEFVSVDSPLEKALALASGVQTFAVFYFVDLGKRFREFGNGSHIPHDFAFFSASKGDYRSLAWSYSRKADLTGCDGDFVHPSQTSGFSCGTSIRLLRGGAVEIMAETS
jgi:hypothetical protein